MNILVKSTPRVMQSFELFMYVSVLFPAYYLHNDENYWDFRIMPKDTLGNLRGCLVANMNNLFSVFSFSFSIFGIHFKFSRFLRLLSLLVFNFSFQFPFSVFKYKRVKVGTMR